MDVWKVSGMLLRKEDLVREIPDTSAGRYLVPTESGGPLQPPAFPESADPFGQRNEPHHCASEVRAFEPDGNDRSRRFSRPRESVWRFVDCCNLAPPALAPAAHARSGCLPALHGELLHLFS